MTREPVTRDERPRNPMVEVFRTDRTLAKHGEQRRRIGEQQATAFGNIDSVAGAISSLGDRTITQRLDAIEPVSSVLARAQGTHTDDLD
ncbi:hypothetical protein [Streptomyces sp. NPDC001635]|nr:hypothetical protein E4K10_47340 [Streptomyces sp. T1317-0309]